MAVYTEVSDDDLIEFVAGYDIGEALSCKGIAEGVENSNFLLTTSEGPFILTLYEKRVNPNDLPFFIGFMDHLATKGVPCPLPIRASDGNALGELSGRPAAIISFLPGLWPRRPQPEHCAEVGRGLAEFHIAGDDFKLGRANNLAIANWRPLLEQSIDRADEVMDGFGDMVSHELDDLENNWPDNLPSGVIHADLFPDNMFFRNGQLSGIIDFYFACTDAYAYDIAICMNAWCFEPDHSFNITKARRLLGNYKRVRDLSTEEMNALPILARGSAMRFLLTRLYDWLNTPVGALVTPKDPMEYWRKLNFHKSVRGTQEYGLDV